MSHVFRITVSDSLYEQLVKRARQTGQEPEAVATEWLGEAVEHALRDSIENLIGAFESGGSDWADNHDRYIGRNALIDTAD